MAENSFTREKKRIEVDGDVINWFLKIRNKFYEFYNPKGVQFRVYIGIDKPSFIEISGPNELLGSLEEIIKNKDKKTLINLILTEKFRR